MSEMKQHPLSPSSSIDFSRLHLETPPDSPMDSGSDDFLLPEQFFSQTDDGYILESEEDIDSDSWNEAYERACPKKTKPASDLEKVVEFYNSVKKENNPQAQNLLNSLQIIIDSYKQQEAILTAATAQVYKELYAKHRSECETNITVEELRRREQLFGYPEKTSAQKAFNNASLALLDLRLQTERITGDWRQQSDSSLSSNKIFSKKVVPDTPGKIDPIRKSRNQCNSEKARPNADLFSSPTVEQNQEPSISISKTYKKGSKFLSPPRPKIIDSEEEIELDLRQTFAGGIEKSKWEQPSIIPFLNPYNSAYDKTLDPSRVPRNSSRFKFAESTAKKQPEKELNIKLSDSDSLFPFELSQISKASL